MDFPSKVIWYSWVPPKVGIFAWEATWSKILTFDKVQKRWCATANRCYLCGKEEESCDLLIHCNVTSGVASSFLPFLECLGFFLL